MRLLLARKKSKGHARCISVVGGISEILTRFDPLNVLRILTTPNPTRLFDPWVELTRVHIWGNVVGNGKGVGLVIGRLWVQLLHACSLPVNRIWADSLYPFFCHASGV